MCRKLIGSCNKYYFFHIKLYLILISLKSSVLEICNLYIGKIYSVKHNRSLIIYNGLVKTKKINCKGLLKVVN